MSTKGRLTAVLSAVAFLCVPIPSAAQSSRTDQAMVLESPALDAGGRLPLLHTQHGPGKDLSPPLVWRNLPERTRALVLVLDGPAYGVRREPFVHWVVYNIPPTATGLPEGLPMDARLDWPEDLAGVTQGLTGWRTPGYRGPYPIRGEAQTFRFTLFALDRDLDLEPGLDKTALLGAIAGHILATAELGVVCDP